MSIINRVKATLLLIAVLLVSGVTYSQYDTLHYIAPTAFSYKNDQTQVVISTLEETTVIAKIYDGSETLLASVAVTKGAPAKQVLSGDITVSQWLPSNTVLTGEGLIVRSNKPVSVNVRDVAGDTYEPIIKGNVSVTSKGLAALGTSFRVLYYRENIFYCSFMAQYDNTHITRNGNVVTTLNAGESYKIGGSPSTAAIGDLIESDKPISATSSHNADSPGSCADPLGDQLIPTAIAGKEHIIVRGGGWDDYYGGPTLTIEYFTVVATEDNTEIFVDGVSNTVLANAGDFATISNGVAMFDTRHVVSDKPVLIAQGAGQGCEHGMSIIPPLGCTGSKHIETIDFGDFSYTVFVISKCSDVVPTLNGVDLTNGAPIAGTDWTLFNFDESAVPNDTIILDSKSPMHVGVLQDGGNFGAFAYFSSFNKQGIQVNASTGVDGSSTISEGCNSGAQFSFIRQTYCGSTDTIQIEVTGTAIEGLDFSDIPSQLIFEEGVDTLSFDMEIYLDNVVEDQENIEISIYADKNCDNIIDTTSAELLIIDYQPMTLDLQQDSILMCVDFEGCTKISDTRTIWGTANQGVGPYSFSWENGVNEVINTAPATSTNTLSEILGNVPPIDATVTLTVTDACSNTVTKSFVVDNDCPLCPPNVITPNADEENTFFKIKNIMQYGDAELVILNRWGNVVYSVTGYQNDFDGADLSEGVYYHQVTRNGKVLSKGFFHIFR